VGDLIVDPRCNVTLPVEPCFDPHRQRFYGLTQATQADDPHREQQVEKIPPMDGRRGARGFRVTRGWADPSSRTTRAVQLDNPSTRTGRTPRT
jgi:hypothetical protein